MMVMTMVSMMIMVVMLMVFGDNVDGDSEHDTPVIVGFPSIPHSAADLQKVEQPRTVLC